MKEDVINYPDAWVTAAAEAAHRTLDAADDGWHYGCLTEPNGPKDCYKGNYARRMLVEDVMPAVLDALAEASALAGPSAGVEAAVAAERQRIKNLLAIPLLQALRLIPDGTLRNGCIVSDGGVARERARQAWQAIDGEEKP